MNVRDFDGTDDRLRFSVGDTAIAIGSIAVYFRKMSDANAILFDAGSGSSQFGIFHFSTGEFRVNYGGSTVDSTFTLVAADGWGLFVIRKATGTATPRFSLYNETTDTWQHQDAGSSLADSPTSLTQYTVAESGSGGANADARFLAIGIWAGNPFADDAAVELLDTGLKAWKDEDPSSLWGFDQASTTTNVDDLSGNNADQTSLTGTTVVDDTDISFNMTLRQFILVRP